MRSDMWMARDGGLPHPLRYLAYCSPGLGMGEKNSRLGAATG